MPIEFDARRLQALIDLDGAPLPPPGHLPT